MSILLTFFQESLLMQQQTYLRCQKVFIHLNFIILQEHAKRSKDRALFCLSLNKSIHLKILVILLASHNRSQYLLFTFTQKCSYSLRVIVQACEKLLYYIILAMHLYGKLSLPVESTSHAKRSLQIQFNIVFILFT